jgi:threonine/homoserine/homoserine lactone efflux protein
VPSELLPFLGVVAVITVIPGPDMALGVRNGVGGGRRATWLTGVGCLTGLVVWASTSVLGLAALLAASGRAFDLVRIAGAVYLAVLGLLALRSAVTGQGGGGRLGLREDVAAEADDPGARSGRTSAGVWFRQGLFSNLLNPKIALLFLTLLPQFVAPHESRAATTAELAVAMLLLETLWWALFAVTVGAVAGALARPRVRRCSEGLAGILLVGLALKLTFER